MPIVGRIVMRLVREVLSLLALAAAAVAALPGVLLVAPAVRAVCKAAADTGVGSSETHQAATELIASSQGAVGWLILAAVLLAIFIQIRVWGILAKL